MTLDHMSRGIDPDPSSPVPSERKRTSRAGTVVAAVVVALIVLAAVVVILATRGGGGSALPATPTPRPSSTSTASAPTTTSTSSSTLPPADRAVPDSPPAGVTWALFQGVALPTSSTSGPLRVARPVYAGYAHTPTGALLAATQISYRYLISPANGWRAVVQQQVVPGTGRDLYVKERAKVTTTDAPGTYGQLAGFRFVTYDTSTAVIQFVTRFSNGNLQVATDTVRWINSDWMLKLQPDGSESPTAQSVSSLAGFVPWSGL